LLVNQLHTHCNATEVMSKITVTRSTTIFLNLK